jgi:hypothetical protein
MLDQFGEPVGKNDRFAATARAMRTAPTVSALHR